MLERRDQCEEIFFRHCDGDVVKGVEISHASPEALSGQKILHNRKVSAIPMEK